MRRTRGRVTPLPAPRPSIKSLKIPQPGPVKCVAAASLALEGGEAVTSQGGQVSWASQRQGLSSL